jgi:formylglycine-generating enzyme required for sulfatase activity
VCSSDLRRASNAPVQALGMEFVAIPGGEFTMGADDADAFDIEKPAHLARVAPFRIARTEVTQAQWRALMENNPSRFSGCDECPVEKVSWDDAREFARRAAAKSGLPLRLPTEAEWEFAARGGALEQKWAGTNNVAELPAYAWYEANAASHTHPVCTKKPNAFGLCDMSGNVLEWVAERFYLHYDVPAAAQPPDDPTVIYPRVYRGGSWHYSDKLARGAFRGGGPPDTASPSVGFRLAYTEASR